MIFYFPNTKAANPLSVQVTNYHVVARLIKPDYSVVTFLSFNSSYELLSNYYYPYRVEDMDMDHNMLYTKECSSGLGYLAHRVFMTDKYILESCCIIGNYYSLKGLHEKAVLYFRSTQTS